MNSPFPGMDPYLERHWPDVHLSLVGAGRDSLNRALPPDLVARAGERVYVESGEADSEPIRERFIQILQVAGGRVVTVVDFLSPGNKLSADGRKAYIEHRVAILASQSNLVEIDLARSGEWIGLLEPHSSPPDYHTAYGIVLRRPSTPNEILLWPIRLQDRLPRIAIPLREQDPLVTLDVQALVDQTYQSGRYDGIDYRKPCLPPLEDDEAAWADELLRAAGRR